MVDLGVLTLRTDTLSPADFPDGHEHLRSGIPRLSPAHPAVVEWRAMTVIELCVTLCSRRDTWDIDTVPPPLSEIASPKGCARNTASRATR